MSHPGAPPAGWLLDPADPSLLRWWNDAVLAALAGLTDEVRQRRGELFTAIRPRVLATAGDDEEVFETFLVTLHDVDPATGGLGMPRGPADLFVTDRRVLAVGDPGLPGGTVVEFALRDVERVTPVGREGVRVDLGHAPPVLLHSEGPGRHGDGLVTLLTTLTS